MDSETIACGLLRKAMGPSHKSMALLKHGIARLIPLEGIENSLESFFKLICYQVAGGHRVKTGPALVALLRRAVDTLSPEDVSSTGSLL